MKRTKSFRATIIVIAALGLTTAFLLTLEWHGLKVSAQLLSCGITEVTFSNGGGNDGASISANGTRIAFWSFNDLTGNNADGSSEIFLYDTTTNGFAQITHTTSEVFPFTTDNEPSVSANGTRIAFSSANNLLGGNLDPNPEIYLYDATTNTIIQVTNMTGTINRGPSVNAAGTRIAFYSDGNLTGGNTDRSYEIFLYDTTNLTITQITNAISGGSVDPSISGDGTRIAFWSSSDLAGSNPDENAEVFLYNTTTNTFTQATNTIGGNNFGPSISSDGTRIAFDSDRDLAGSNADGNGEIFLYNTITNTITQITNTTAGGNDFPSINGDGRRIAFRSSSNLTGGNADGSNEIFVYDATINTFTQVSDNPINMLAPSISDDGARIAFPSNGFANLGNADGNREIFLASCVPASANLFIDQTADTTKVKQGETLTYTLTVGNIGPEGAVDVMVFDELSSGVGFVSAQANKGSFTTPPVGQTGIVIWNLGPMASFDRETAEIQVTVVIRGRDIITNTARVISSIADPDGTNNSSSLTTTVQPGKKK